MLLLQIPLIFHALRNDQISGADTGFFPVGGGGGDLFFKKNESFRDKTANVENVEYMNKASQKETEYPCIFFSRNN